MPDREALRKLRPRNRVTRKQLLAITAYLAVAIAAAAGLAYLKDRTQRYREQSWPTAIATVEDTRTKLVGQAGGIQGAGMLYSVEVLVRFYVDGSPQERWIAVEQAPRNLDSVQFQERLWRGKQCFVRWNPSNPAQIVAEIN
jgi:hypothetical protein